jgi:hypothetical protein
MQSGLKDNDTIKEWALIIISFKKEDQEKVSTSNAR